MMRATILGCGSSGGVPRLGNEWGECDPENPKNQRLRCALLVEKIDAGQETRVLIDAGPDFRQQMLRANVPMLDALVLTHEHADHIHGIDDMRQFVNIKAMNEIEKRALDPTFEMSREIYHDILGESRIDCFAGLSCHEALMTRFDYLFQQREGTLYPPIMNMHKIEGNFEIDGAGGAVSMQPFAVPHGSIHAYGFRIDDLVYLPDVFDLTDMAREIMQDVGVLIIDCLQFRAHGTHANYEKAMSWVEELKPDRAILTNLHIAMDYETLNAMTPDHVTPAYDGMEILF